MGVKERILSIRLMEKLWEKPDLAKALGIEVLFEKAASDSAGRRMEG